MDFFRDYSSHLFSNIYSYYIGQKLAVTRKEQFHSYLHIPM